MPMNFGTRLQQLLDEKEISRKEFAAMTGLTEAAISRYVTGQREPKAFTASLMANALGVSMNELLGTASDNPEELDGAVRLVARSAKKITPEQKQKLISALLNSLE